MRVISGQKRGLKLLPPDEASPVRPTADRVKESVFNLIAFDLGGCFLDLFCGSGQVGIEALSRGCEKVVFCDNSQESVDLTKANLKKSGLGEKSEVFLGDYKKYLRATPYKFKIIFIDPPYSNGISQKALDEIGKDESCLSEDGIVVVECKNNENYLERYGRLSLLDRRKYGLASVLLYTVSQDGKQGESDGQ